MTKEQFSELVETRIGEYPFFNDFSFECLRSDGDYHEAAGALDYAKTAEKAGLKVRFIEAKKGRFSLCIGLSDADVEECAAYVLSRGDEFIQVNKEAVIKLKG